MGSGEKQEEPGIPESISIRTGLGALGEGPHQGRCEELETGYQDRNPAPWILRRQVERS